MQLSQLTKKYEKLGSILTDVPSEIRDRFIVRKFPRDTVICKKDEVKSNRLRTARRFR